MSPRLTRNAIIFIVILTVLGAITWIFMPHKPSTPQIPAKPIETTNQPTTGHHKAALHIVAFEDLKCSNCMRFNTTLLPKIMHDYVRTGRATYTVVTLAFLPGSPPAGNAALCIYAQKPNAFFDYIEKIYQNQPPETENWATIPKLMNFAQGIQGINLDKLADCLVQGRYDAQLQKNMQLAGKVMGNNNIATPSVYINGRVVTPLTWNQFKLIANEAK